MTSPNSALTAATLTLLLAACAPTPQSTETTSAAPSPEPTATPSPEPTVSSSSGPAVATVDVPEFADAVEEWGAVSGYWSALGSSRQRSSCETFADPALGDTSADAIVTSIEVTVAMGEDGYVDQDRRAEYDHEVMKAILLSFCDD